MNGRVAYRGDYGGGIWVIECKAHVMVRVKRIFARVQVARSGDVRITDTPEVARDLLWMLERWPMSMRDADRRRLEARAQEHVEAETTLKRVLDGGSLAVEGACEPALPPRDYQRIAGDMILATGRLLLTDELGLGKTLSGALALRHPDSLPALVVTLTHLPAQWVAELARFFPLLRTHILRRGTPYDLTKLRSLHGHQPDVIVTNYAKLAGWADYLAGTMRTVIFDEAQELRRAESQRYVAAGRIADGARFRAGLTATPVYNYGGEIYNVINVLAPDALGTREEFAREWGIGDSSTKMSVANPAALGEHLRAEGLMLRRTRADVGRELPDVVRVPHTIEGDEAELERLSEGSAELADLILEGSSKERFQASGDLDWRMRHATGVAKAPYVASFVSLLLESEEAVVLFGWHRDCYALWEKQLAPWNPAFYTGSESPAAKQRSEEAFLSGESRVLIMSLRSGAGLDGLQERTNVAVFGELDWSPGIHDQAIGRLHRDGQTEPVVAYFLVSAIGSDPVVADVLNLKRMQSEPLSEPNAPLFTEAPNTQDRVRRLAEDVRHRAAKATPRTPR